MFWLRGCHTGVCVCVCVCVWASPGVCVCVCVGGGAAKSSPTERPAERPAADKVALAWVTEEKGRSSGPGRVNDVVDGDYKFPKGSLAYHEQVTAGRRVADLASVLTLLVLCCIAPMRAVADEPTVLKPVPNLDLSTFRTIPSPGGRPLQTHRHVRPGEHPAHHRTRAVHGPGHQGELGSGRTGAARGLPIPDYWRTQPSIEIRNEWLNGPARPRPQRSTCTACGMTRYFRRADLATNTVLDGLIRKVSDKQKSAGEKLDEQEPAPSRTCGTSWTASLASPAATASPSCPTPPTRRPAGYRSESSRTGRPIIRRLHQRRHPARHATAFQGMLVAYNGGDASAFQEDSVSLASALQKMPKSADVYPSAHMMAVEVQYNAFHPFRWAWILYASAFVALLLFAGSKSKLRLLGWHVCSTPPRWWSPSTASTCAAPLPVAAGSRTCTSPSSGSLFGATFFAFIFEMIYKVRRFAIAASAVGTIGLVLADNLPNNLISGPASALCTPALRSNYWLTIHVLTITASYAAFFLTWGPGQYLRPCGSIFRQPSGCEGRHRLPWLDTSTRPCRSVCCWSRRVPSWAACGPTTRGAASGVGIQRKCGPSSSCSPTCSSCTAATPAAQLKDFGTVVASVVCFLSVVMAWYGVNDVLGVGLHSYGFGVGGRGLRPRLRRCGPGLRRLCRPCATRPGWPTSANPGPALDAAEAGHLREDASTSDAADLKKEHRPQPGYGHLVKPFSAKPVWFRPGGLFCVTSTRIMRTAYGSNIQTVSLGQHSIPGGIAWMR